MTHSPALALARDALLNSSKLVFMVPSKAYLREQALAAIDAELAASADAGKLAEEATEKLAGAAEFAMSVLQGIVDRHRIVGDVRHEIRTIGDAHPLAMHAAERLERAIMSFDAAALSRPAPATTAPVSAQGDERAAAGPWKCGNEFLPYHPSASHVEPSYRDGWNACYKAGLAARAQVAQGDEVDVDEPLLHTDITDVLPESHPLAHEHVYCDTCGASLHASNNECMQPWVEKNRRDLYRNAGNFCLACYAKAGGHPWPADAARAQQGGQG